MERTILKNAYNSKFIHQKLKYKEISTAQYTINSSAANNQVISLLKNIRALLTTLDDEDESSFSLYISLIGDRRSFE